LSDVFTSLALSHIFIADKSLAPEAIREHQLRALRCYLCAVWAVGGNVRVALDGERATSSLGAEPSLELGGGLGAASAPGSGAAAEDDEDEQEEEEGEAAAGKGKAATGKGKAAVPAPAVDGVMSEAEKAELARSKAQLAQIVAGLPSRAAAEQASDAATRETALKRLEMIEQLLEKVDDIFLVLENREAAEAITGAAADIVTAGIDEAATGSGLASASTSGTAGANGFDKPTLSEIKAETETGPTNLLQVRKKAATPGAPAVPPGEGFSAPSAHAEAMPVTLLAPKRKPAAEDAQGTDAKRAKV
jgi:hypothetical protein